MNFSEKLTALRRREGMSQEQLADRLGVTRQSVSKWESGAAQPELAKGSPGSPDPPPKIFESGLRRSPGSFQLPPDAATDLLMYSMDLDTLLRACAAERENWVELLALFMKRGGWNFVNHRLQPLGHKGYRILSQPHSEWKAVFRLSKTPAFQTAPAAVLANREANIQ